MNRFLYAHVVLPGEQASFYLDQGGPFAAVHDPSTGVRATMGVIQVGFDDNPTLYPLVLIAVNEKFVDFFCDAARKKMETPSFEWLPWGKEAHALITRAATGGAKPLSYQITRCDLHSILNGNSLLYTVLSKTLREVQPDLPFGRVTYLGLSGGDDYLVRKPDGGICNLDDLQLFPCLQQACTQRDPACPESAHPKCPQGFTISDALPVRDLGGSADTADTADTASAWPWVIASAIASVGAVAVVGYALSGRSARRY